LRYGPEFRPIRELAAGEGRSTGRVALSEKAAQRAGEYPLHPVLLDGALQVFSAGAATVEGRRARLKLPVRFDRILFLRSPGARTLVRSRLRQFSDEFVEGELCLYDEKERPCVLVDGFRAISVAGFRQSGSPRGRDILYHVGWQRTPEPSRMTAGEPVPLGGLQRAASDTLEEVVAARGRAKLEADLAACDDLAAGQLARGLREAGLATPDGVIAPDCIGVADSMRPAFERLLNGLARHGLLEAVGSGYRPAQAFEIAAESAEGSLRRFLSKHPGLLCEGLLCAANCAELGPILRGEKDAVQILFSAARADLLDQFYADGLFTSHWLAAIAGAVREAARHLPEGRGLRILEVGAGTGGLTSHILPLLEPSLHAYTFSDVSAAFFAGAMQKFAEFPGVKFEVLDLEKPATEQGFEAGGFDLVLGANVFHAVSEVRIALRNVCELLAPGGSLVFIDIATPQLWTDAIFGLTTGWWRFKDRDLRPEHPLLQRSQWERLLLDSGFSEAASLPGLVVR
jgi:SAM-dependent methyltransferase